MQLIKAHERHAQYQAVQDKKSHDFILFIKLKPQNLKVRNFLSPKFLICIHNAYLSYESIY